MAPKTSNPEPEVLKETIAPLADSQTLISVKGVGAEPPARSRNVSKAAQRLRSGLLWRQPLRFQLLSPQLQVEGNLLVHALVDGTATSEHKPEEPTHPWPDHAPLAGSGLGERIPDTNWT